MSDVDQAAVDHALDNALAKWREMRLAEHSVHNQHMVPVKRGKFVVAMSDLEAIRLAQRSLDNPDSGE